MNWKWWDESDEGEKWDQTTAFGQDHGSTCHLVDYKNFTELPERNCKGW